MKNYTGMFLMLVVASISGGMALNNTFDFEYSMLVGYGLALVFWLCAVIAESRKRVRNSKKTT